MQKSDLYFDMGAQLRAERMADAEVEAFTERMGNKRAHADGREDCTSRVQSERGITKPYAIYKDEDGRYYWHFDIDGFIESCGGPFDKRKEAEVAAKTAVPTALWDGSRAFTTGFSITRTQWLG